MAALAGRESLTASRRLSAVLQYTLAAAALLILSIVRLALYLIAPPRPIDAGPVLFRVGLDMAIWAVLAIFVLWFANHARISRRTFIWAVPAHLAGAVAFMLAQSFALTRLAQLVVAPMDLRFAVVLYGQAHLNFLAYWTLAGVAHAWDYARRYRDRDRHAARLELQRAQLEAQLSRAELSALQSQLQPHFLFNTLNAVTAYIHDEPDRAERMLTGLGRLLRSVLESSRSTERPLRDELAFLDEYLQLQHERFGDRLEVRRRLSDDALNALLPVLLLQPIVENALQHGVAPRLSGGRIDIEARCIGDSLEIIVRDHSTGPHAEATGGMGVGLANTRARLAQLYGDTFRFDARALAEGFEVTVRIPRKIAP